QRHRPGRAPQLAAPQQFIDAAFQRTAQLANGADEIGPVGRRDRTWRYGRWPGGIDRPGLRWFGRPRRGDGRIGGLVGGKDFDPAMDPLVGNDECVRAQRQADLAHGFAVRGTEESADVHEGLPPMTATMRIMRSSGISALDSTPIWGMWCRRKRDKEARR